MLHSKIVGKKKPGLSSFADQPEGALKPLQWLFEKFMKEEGPKYYSRTIEVKIFGTAGMRLLASDKREGVWKAVSQGLQKYFDKNGTFLPASMQFSPRCTTTLPSHALFFQIAAEPASHTVQLLPFRSCSFFELEKHITS